MRLNPPLRPLRDERGFSMIVVMVVLLASGMFVAGAFATADADLPFSLDGLDRKRSYTAADAGLSYYQSRLNVDNEFWTQCTGGGPGVNQEWTGTGTDPRSWRTVPGGEEQYTVELLPAPGKAECIPGDNFSMIDPATSTFRVRVTGRAREDDANRRSLVATYRRSSFLDFIYFTTYETSDPLTYPPGGTIAPGDATAKCGDKERARRDPYCREIEFITGDEIRGPFHTEDDIRTCGTPMFGREPQAGKGKDRIEILGPGADPDGDHGYHPVCSGGTPNWRGDKIAKADVKSLVMPTTNAELMKEAAPDYLFTGKTTIRLNGASMNVTTHRDGLTRTMSLPPNGVIFVRNANCTVSLPPPPMANYAEPADCATATVSGTYSKSLTIASENDIVVNGDIVKSGDPVLGLIAEDFVRVAHPVDRSAPGSGFSRCKETQPGLRHRRIDAAILSLLHSFTVDNFACGDERGTLTVNGAIAQKYRGPVGSRGGPDGTTGYMKNYVYDDRLRFRSPPYFLTPVASAWKAVRINEQVPTR